MGSLKKFELIRSSRLADYREYIYIRMSSFIIWKIDDDLNFKLDKYSQLDLKDLVTKEAPS